MTTTALRTLSIAGAGLLVAVLLGACAPKTTVEDKVIIGQGDGFLPGETLTDWVSYANQVSEVTVTSEQEMPPPKDVLDRQRGYIARRVTLRIDNNIWVNPNSVTAQGEISFFASGWLLKGDKRYRFALVNSPRLEVGGHYILPLTQVPDADGNLTWAPLTTGSVMAAANDAIAEADVVGPVAILALRTHMAAGPLLTFSMH